ncbi:hypothetical protein EVAR_80323_1 [Eumeta japonica]|uniref:Uncharacterized protein n=1 Tax=Eumeta variegata TaxID=151549 RepID=A0A4C1UCQ2_EUMVA|nr:hypothetical protein EVAR_80323_1 [Eumeta japonica]
MKYGYYSQHNPPAFTLDFVQTVCAGSYTVLIGVWRIDKELLYTPLSALSLKSCSTKGRSVESPPSERDRVKASTPSFPSSDSKLCSISKLEQVNFARCEVVLTQHRCALRRHRPGHTDVMCNVSERTLGGTRI